MLIVKSQIFHAFLFNIRNYWPEVINIQRRKAELNIVLPRVNNFDIKQKKAWNICFIIYHQHQTRSGKIKITKQQISVKTQVFFVQIELQHITTATAPSKAFYIVFVDIISEIIKINRIRIFPTWNWQLIRDWREIKVKGT